jgi:hypothetical protein
MVCADGLACLSARNGEQGAAFTMGLPLSDFVRKNGLPLVCIELFAMYLNFIANFHCQ